MTVPVIRGVNHIGITVPDIEAAKSFLVEALGGQVIYQSFGPQDPPRQGPEFERATGAFPGTVVRAQAMVKIGSGPDIELFEMDGPEQALPVRPSDLGITHFGLYTDDIDASVERFEKAGGTPLPRRALFPMQPKKVLETRSATAECHGARLWNLSPHPTAWAITTKRICAGGRTRNEEARKGSLVS